MSSNKIIPADFGKAPRSVFSPAKRADVGSFDLAYRLDTAVWLFDIDNATILKANEAACRLWQAKSEAELCGRNLREDMSSTVANRLRQYQTDFVKNDARFSEVWTLYPNGEPRSVMVTYRGFVLPDGRMAMQCEALAEDEDTPENLRSAEALLHTDVLIALFEQDGPALYLNPAARSAFGRQAQQFADLCVDTDQCAQALAQVDDVGEHRCVNRLTASHGVRWYDLTIKKVSDAATGQPAILITAIDVTELKEARDSARYLADRDQLTELYNRTYLQSHLSEISTRYDGQSALIFFDVDRFKLINDRHGHDSGDSVLCEIAKRARAVFRTNDLVARLGGDEFVVLVETFEGEVQLDALIARLRAALSKPVIHDKSRIDVAISVGVSIFSPAQTDLSQVLGQADIALYASKAAGRNRVTYFTDEMGAAAQARDQLEFELTQAIARDEFVLHYQPRQDVATGRIVGVEGLARWRHPERGLVLPTEFIQVCEETGLIEDLGRQVLRDGCNQAIKWRAAGYDLDVSLNVSPRQFSDPTFLNTLAELAAEPDFPRGHIELEVTENVLIGDPEAIAEKLRAITQMGYGVAIDDFGTGYSNLAYIARFPLSCLKIDRSFLSQLPEAAPIMELIFSLSDQIGAITVCEGVETNQQLSWLRDKNCQQVQGHLIAAPMSVENLEIFLGKAL